MVLIAKNEHSVSMKDYRPIALCNAIYKILSKTLAIISEEQSAFIARRSIMDNVLIALKITHYLKCKQSDRRGELALKVDINKAYDRVDWGYLEAVMRKMGFNDS